MNKLKQLLLVVASSAALLVPVVASAPTYAASGCGDHIQQQISTGVNTATGSSGSGCATNTNIQTGIGKAAVVAVNILSLVVGIVAVIMIIYGGFRYITSGGDSGGVESAKKTLLYAIIGLVIVALAQFIVRWVLGTTTNIAG